MAERSKALRSGRSLERGVGSNPTSVIRFAAFASNTVSALTQHEPHLSLTTSTNQWCCGQSQPRRHSPLASVYSVARALIQAAQHRQTAQLAGMRLAFSSIHANQVLHLDHGSIQWKSMRMVLVKHKCTSAGAATFSAPTNALPYVLERQRPMPLYRPPPASRLTSPSSPPPLLPLVWQKYGSIKTYECTTLASVKNVLWMPCFFRTALYRQPIYSSAGR